MTELFPYPLRIYAELSVNDRYDSYEVEVDIANTVCNYQYTDSFLLSSEFFGSNYAYINCPYALVPEGDLSSIDLEKFPQFAGFNLASANINIWLSFTTAGGAQWRSSIIKMESLKVGKIGGYEVGTTFWVELGK